MPDDRPPVEDVKQALARLVAEEPTARSRAVVEIASEAVEDIEHAAAFVVADGLARLEQAVDLARRTDDRQLLRAGQRTLAALERFRCAAAAEPKQNGDHFRRGHGMDLMQETKRGDR